MACSKKTWTWPCMDSSKDLLLTENTSSRITKPQKSRKHKKVKPAEAKYEGSWVVEWKADKLKQSNQRPLHDDSQEVPKAVQEIKHWQDHKHDIKKKKKKKPGHINMSEDPLMKKFEKGMTRPLKPVPSFKQGKREKEKDFVNRVERETQIVIQKSQFEDKFQIDVEKVQNSGKNIYEKTKGKKKLRELNRLKEKKVKKKEKLAQDKEDCSDFSKFEDHVAFGEVAMEPPSLTAKPRKAEILIGKERPGKKSLLLKEILARNQAHMTKEREVGKSVKRKTLSLAQRRIMDSERDRAIQLYRDLKLKK